MAHRLRAAPVVALTLALAASAVRAQQCPDGSPPPCAAPRARPAARVTPPSAAERGRRFLVLPFRNVTRGADQEWLVEGSTAILAEALGRWQGVSVVSDERLYPALRRAGIAPGGVADQARVRRVAEETGGWTAVTGDVYAIAGKVRVSARGYDVVTGQEIVRAASEVLATADVRVAYDSVGTRLLRAAGLDTAAVDVGDATTRSLDAFRAYSRGLAHQRRAEIRGAQEAFQEAVRLDSTFALAWARLAEMTLAGDPASIYNPASPGVRYAARAVALSSRLPPRHRQLVLATDANLHVQFADTRRILEGLLAADSNDVDALQRMVGLEMFDPILVAVPGGQRPRGSLQTAARLAQRVVDLDPSRHAVYAVLASLYANAGMPGAGPALGVARAPASLPDLVQSLQQRENLRIYYPVLLDTLGVVPAESVSAIPREVLQASRRRARAIARSWAQRWVAVAPGEAAAHVLSSELLALDGEYPAALREVAVAESLGVQVPTWSPRSRRLLFLAKAGRLADADRIADSLTAAGFFANPSSVLANQDAVVWAYLLSLRAGRAAQAGALLDQLAGTLRLVNTTMPAQALTAYRVLLGNAEPDEEPGIPRAVRAETLDSLLRHVAEVAAAERLGPWLPMLLPDLAELAGQERERAPALLRAAEALEAAGRTLPAFQLAANAVSADSTIRSQAEGLAWYRSGAEALQTVRSATQDRFHPATATVGAERATFEWRVDDAAPFTWNRAESPLGRVEYAWDVDVEVGGRYYRLTAASPPPYPGVAAGSGPLADLLVPSALRAAFTGAVGANGVRTDTTQLQGVVLRTEAAPGVLRMIVTDRGVLDALRQARPAQARFRFRPCARPVGGAQQCVDERVTIGYP